MSLVRYDWRELRQMAGYGSLFLHHVRLVEGKLLYSPHESELAALLKELPPYGRAQQELSSFVQVLDDVEDALRGDHSPAFELAVIATALRHSYILGCYAVGEPRFGRRSAFDLFLRRAGCEDLIEAAQQLYNFRLYEDGRGTLPFTATTTDVRLWLTRVPVRSSERWKRSSMVSTDECLKRIDDVVAAAADPRAAYLIRSRLRRAILSCARLVAESNGAPKPGVPGVFATPPESNASDARVIALCNRIFFSAREPEFRTK